MATIKPTTSPKRVEANRRNAQRSTGPKSEQGKANSRGNATKHGLTGQGIALPTEVKEQVESLFEAFRDDYAPQNTAGLALTYLAALSLTRVKRAAQHETAAIAANIRHLLDQEREQRLTDADNNLAYLGLETPTRYRRLLATPEGIEVLIGRFEQIRGDIGNPAIRFNYIHSACLENAFGRTFDDKVPTRSRTLSKALEHEDDFLTDDERDEIETEFPDTDCCVALWAAPRMHALIDAEIARLRSIQATLRPATLELDRAEVADRALFSASREAALARRYEAYSTRNLLRAIRDLEAMNAQTISEDDPQVAKTLAPPSATAQKVIEAVDATPVRDPADDPAPRKPERAPDFRLPLASFGVTAVEASREISYPHVDLGRTPNHRPTPDVLIARNKRNRE